MATGLALQHALALVEEGEGLALLEVDDEALHAGLDDGHGAVHGGESRGGFGVGCLFVEGRSAVHLCQGPLEVREVADTRFRTAGCDEQETGDAGPGLHAMRSNPV